ncbi:hypothetical protein [Bartonella sp. 1-1C]|uniref:hypothetical protein n=1 Tax=Bartonella sp. 1-1C TaxID=515256 RepID=UPI000C05BC82|nr:hypothetical protein [Bartonella sp. 1-1C]ATO57759.1 hypothetical protein B11Cv2_010010 [Bartonella sp. 1-1C]
MTFPTERTNAKSLFLLLHLKKTTSCRRSLELVKEQKIREILEAVVHKKQKLIKEDKSSSPKISVINYEMQREHIIREMMDEPEAG